MLLNAVVLSIQRPERATTGASEASIDVLSDQRLSDIGLAEKLQVIAQLCSDSPRRLTVTRSLAISASIDAENDTGLSLKSLREPVD